jgi:hypothetical protein
MSHSGTHSEGQRMRNERLGSVADAAALCDSKVTRIGMPCMRSTRAPTGPSELL